MVIADSNKGSYFVLEINLDIYMGIESKILSQKIENGIDIVLAKMNANENVYKFVNRNKYIYFFGTSTRKRKGQLNKIIEEILIKPEIIEEYYTAALLKTEFKKNIELYKKDKNLKLTIEPTIFSNYNGNDIRFLDNPSMSNWYPWQRELHQEIYYKTGEIKPANSRRIIFLYDEKGNSGKSTWFKYEFWKNPTQIGVLCFGTASQLRSSLVNMGDAKKIYLVDIPRSKEKNASDSDLLNAIESLKNGLVQSSMYGGNNILIMEPPHIIVSSNYLFEDTGLSKDRWVIFQIENKKLINITEKVIRKIIKEKYKENKIKKLEID